MAGSGIALGMDFEACSGLISNDFLDSKTLMIRKSTEMRPKSTELGAFSDWALGY